MLKPVLGKLFRLGLRCDAADGSRAVRFVPRQKRYPWVRKTSLFRAGI